MAATLSSFLPPLFRTSLQPPERFEGDFSYSYSDLPVFRSRDNDSKLEQDGGQNHRQKLGGNLVRKRSACDGGIFGVQENFCYEERKAVSLPYQNVDRCISLPRAKFDFQTACTNLPPKSSVSVDKDVQNPTNQRGLKFKIIPNKSSGIADIQSYNNSSKCEETKKRFEFQTTCTNLPPKNIDKENRVSYEGQISNALRFKLKNRCEEARKKFEFRTACDNNFAKPLTEGLIRRESSCKSSPNKTVERERKFEFRTPQNNTEKFDFHNSSRVSPSKVAHESASNAPFIFKSGDSRNLPPKTFDRNNEDKSNFAAKKPESIIFIDEIAAYLRKSDQRQQELPPSKTATVGNAVNSDDIFDFDVTDAPKDSSTVESSVRRLRNSIFSSLKLPRRLSDQSKMAGQQNLMMGSLGRDGTGPRNYALVTGSLTSSGNSKRKSAVEMLAESKAFYVKSETVLDRKQELPLRVNSALASTTGAHYATLSGRHRRGGGEALQSQLRRLLGSTSMQSPNDAVTHESRNNQAPYYEKRLSRECCEWEIPSHPSSATRSHYNSGTFSGNSSSGTSGSKGQVKSDPEHSRTSNSVPFPAKGLNRPSSSGDNRIFFPDSFVVPKPSRSDPANVFSNSFSIGSPFSSPEKIDARQILSVVDAYEGSDYGILDPKSNYYDDGDLIEDFSTISPPAEYAITERSNYRYVRSNSHSHTMKVVPDNSYAININSHKSLPDLHKQAEHYTEEERRLSGASGGPNYLGVVCDPSVPRLPQCDTTMRSSEALSSYSKATSGRSNRSSVFSSKASDGHSRRSISCHNSDPSAQTLDDTYYYNRSGSSYARDSGGSSGHCSGGPPSLRVPPAQQQRRDSGSSTQHSRSHRYSSYYDGYELESSHLEYRVSAPPQFQDGATTPYQQGSLKSQYQGDPMVAPVPPHQLQPQYQQSQAPQQYQGDGLHHQPSQLNVNATVQICANFGGRGMQGATLTRVATGIEDGRSQTLVGIHFQASIPPVQFQDGQPQGYGSYGSEGFYGRRESGARESRHMMPLRSSSAYNQVAPPRYSRPVDDQTQPIPNEDATTSPPGLGNFRRQRCLRYKQRRPVLRSKSDISDRYYRGDSKTLPLMDKPSSNTPPSSTDNESPDRITRSQLDKFFDQFGLNDESYQTIILSSLQKPSKSKTKPKSGCTDQQNNMKKSSPNHVELAANINANCGSPKVYVQEDENAESSDSLAFSEISIADSNLIANNGDYTVQGMGTKDPRLYRSCEPPSIVERNARIIKWLCNCRKLQAA